MPVKKRSYGGDTAIEREGSEDQVGSSATFEAIEAEPETAQSPDDEIEQVVAEGSSVAYIQDGDSVRRESSVFEEMWVPGNQLRARQKMVFMTQSR